MNKSDYRQFLIDLGNRIAKFRKEHNLTQDELAKKMGVQQSSIASYESGRRQIPITQLFFLSEILYVDIEDLLGLNKKINKPGPISRLEKMIKEIQKLPKRKQELVIEFFESFIKNNL